MGCFGTTFLLIVSLIAFSLLFGPLGAIIVWPICVTIYFAVRSINKAINRASERQEKRMEALVKQHQATQPTPEETDASRIRAASRVE